MQVKIAKLINKQLAAAVLTMLPCLFVHAGEIQLGGLCTEQELAKTGKYAQFNREQCEIAARPVRSEARQKGATCVCEAVLNVGFELGLVAKDESLPPQNMRACQNISFGDEFAKLRSTEGYTGKLFGGLSGAQDSKSWVRPQDAIRKVSNAVSNGYVVAIGLHITPIYAYLIQRYGLVKESSPPRTFAPHALVVRAVYLSEKGEATHFFVTENSGPFSVYPVPYEVFREAYSAIRVTLARGVYISDAQRPTY